MQGLKNVLELEKSVQEMLADLKAQLYKDVSETKLDDVTLIGNNAATVKLSALNNFILSPSYYIPSSQAEAIERKLSTVKTATDFVNELRRMVNERKVKIGSDTTMLNSKTIEVLERYLVNI